ncbi:MAG: 1-deoxy-D-xylulose-5-phosphate reductoisomerase [Clostridia bacterium]|nr:MAG: 1-deoxy-D-xylulose-5-phosphate reductoisomerase [Clostridia bacterium]
MKNLVLLGATGSIGTQTLEVAEEAGYRLLAMAVGSRIDAFEEQLRRFRPAFAAVYDEKAAADLKVRIADLPIKVLSGMDGLCTLAALPKADLVLNAVVGMVGLLPTMAAIGAGHDVALANKETLVAGGAFVMDAVRKNGVRLLPVDSEHSAVFQCLQGKPEKGRVRRLILTASGGPFFGYTKEKLETVTPQMALKHPNWSMGAKITVDSASMMNKGLEIIEARWLFDMPEDRIDVVVHRESVVHSLVEYDDGAVLAQLGEPDMRVPIQYALTYPDRLPSPVKRLSLADWGRLTFFAPDDAAFPAMQVCREALRRGGAYPAAVNAVNERAVALFLAGKLPFSRIPALAEETLAKTLPTPSSVEDILEIDRCMRSEVTK